MTRDNRWEQWLPMFSRRRSHADPWLLMAVAMLIGFGLIMVFNASYFYGQVRFDDPYHFFRKHLFAMAVGSALLVVALQVKVRWFEKLHVPLLVLTVGLLLAVLAIGISRGGAQRWIYLGAVNFQPSELAKVAIVLYLAASITHYREQMEDFSVGILRHLLVTGLVAGLIVVQPDLSTAVVLLAVAVLMLFYGGARVAHLASIGVVGLLAIAAKVAASGYQFGRISAVLDPWKYKETVGFQLVQSMVAFGTGGISGVGLGESDQKMFFLPEAHTDFIFSLVGEELGVLGALAVLGLFTIVGVRGFLVAYRHPDPFARLLAFGLTTMILVQAVVNIGVTVGLCPTTGIALPFVSYGGSALMIAMLEVGILASLSRMSN